MLLLACEGECCSLMFYSEKLGHASVVLMCLLTEWKQNCRKKS